MNKKLITFAAGAALLLTVAVPAFAKKDHEHQTPPLPTLTIASVGNVDNDVITLSNTGFNSTGSQNDNKDHGRGDKSKGGSIDTGNALSIAGVGSDVNNVTVNGCGCKGNTTVSSLGTVDNFVLTVSNTGFNYAGNGKIDTGNAGSQSTVSNWVNTVVVGS